MDISGTVYGYANNSHDYLTRNICVDKIIAPIHLPTSVYDIDHSSIYKYTYYCDKNNKAGVIDRLFDNSVSRWYMDSGTAGGIGQIYRNIKMPVYYYGITTTSETNVWLTRMPKTWKLFGSNNGSTWVEMDSRTYDFTTYTGYTPHNITVYFKCKNPGSYNYIRFQWYTNCGNNEFQMAMLLLYDKGNQYLFKNNDSYQSDTYTFPFDDYNIESIMNKYSAMDITSTNSIIKNKKGNYKIIKIK